MTHSLGRVDRRDAIKSFAAGATLLPILPAAGQHAGHNAAHNAAPTAASAAYTPQLIKGRERELLTAVCERILPRTDTPGATDAGVADEIDWMATRRNGLAKQVAEALARVEKAAGTSFPSLPVARQDEVLRRMSSDLSTADGKAFELLKHLTLDAYYNSKAGLTEELGWHGNTYLPEFEGCTHEHASVAANTPEAMPGTATTEVAE